MYNDDVILHVVLPFIFFVCVCVVTIEEPLSHWDILFADTLRICYLDPDNMRLSSTIQSAVPASQLKPMKKVF